MEMNSFKSLIETTNQVMQSNQEQLNEASPIAAVQATKPIWSNWLGDAQKPSPTPERKKPITKSPELPKRGERPDVQQMPKVRVPGKIGRLVAIRPAAVPPVAKPQPRPQPRTQPEPTLKQRLMRGARRVGEFARRVVTNPVDTLSKTEPVKAVAKLTLAKDKMTRDSGDVAASGLKGAGLDSAARVTRRATRKSPTGNIIDKGSNLLDKAKSAIADRASRPRQMSRGGDPKTYSR